jgi:hypothetical protein
MASLAYRFVRILVHTIFYGSITVTPGTHPPLSLQTARAYRRYQATTNPHGIVVGIGTVGYAVIVSSMHQRK